MSDASTRWRSVVRSRTFRLSAALVCSVGLVWLTQGIWIPRVGQSLVCAEHIGHADAILIENLDENYDAFQRAAALQRAGVATRVLVPTEASLSDPSVLNAVSEGIVGVMARVASVQNVELFPVQEIEPITLNAAYQVRNQIKRRGVTSVVMVAPAFRSRRSMMVFERVLGAAGVSVTCVPALGQTTPETWAHSTHGIQEVVAQFLKLQYYRFYVLPFRDDASPVVLESRQ